MATNPNEIKAGDRVRLKRSETTELIRRSNGRVLCLGFGPSGVWLKRTDGWEIQELAEIRSTQEQAS